MLGASFDYDYLPSLGAAGGFYWLGRGNTGLCPIYVTRGCFSLSAKLAAVAPTGDPWWITVVYGPQLDVDKVEFLNELKRFRDVSPGPWLLCGDFNMA
jgi:hypothetical protein